MRSSLGIAARFARKGLIVRLMWQLSEWISSVNYVPDTNDEAERVTPFDSDTIRFWQEKHQ